jgi:hypothetical protein
MQRKPVAKRPLRMTPGRRENLSVFANVLVFGRFWRSTRQHVSSPIFQVTVYSIHQSKELTVGFPSLHKADGYLKYWGRNKMSCGTAIWSSSLNIFPIRLAASPSLKKFSWICRHCDSEARARTIYVIFKCLVLCDKGFGQRPYARPPTWALPSASYG